MKTPDITLAQLTAAIVALGGQLVTWGLLSGHLEKLVVSIATIAVSVTWIAADAIIRHGRATRSSTLAELSQLAGLLNPTTTSSTSSSPTATG